LPADQESYYIQSIAVIVNTSRHCSYKKKEEIVAVAVIVVEVVVVEVVVVIVVVPVLTGEMYFRENDKYRF
jgi:deoxyinosine 3'endonuclease (endonuclease V)